MFCQGSMLRLDVWDGWKEFLMGCLLGQTLKVQRYLSKEGPVLKYQRRVALYIAAVYGHMELTEWALKQGARPHEAVGAHPYRAWCQEGLHADVAKCPVHAAVEAGQLLVLKAFVRCSVLGLACRDPGGHTPLALACKHQQRDCALYLLSKLWSTVSFLKVSLPMRLYIKIKHWVLRAQSRSLHKRHFGGAKMAGARVGDTVMVDGFTKPKMTSKSWWKTGKQTSPCHTGGQLPPLGEQNAHRKSVRPLAASQLPPREQGLKLPPLAEAQGLSGLQRRLPPKREKMSVTAGKKASPLLRNTYLPQVPLPAGSRVAYWHPKLYYATPRADFELRSSFAPYSEHSGKTPRENAVYCLTVASAFKEKRWLQQLEIARALAKKSISNLTTQGGLIASENPLKIVL
ncbi:protein ANKUB1 isoform X2 [Erinaceus europaeus]|uniref:Protein ANKUB1 isoform X2 n=1 Tax=Erinaceus europaeus TaxID=9365 RepID=A0ABM3XXH1_ERIEU|nr:protein ANKUB1 isoform X2 [Erinaceus europaeus]